MFLAIALAAASVGVTASRLTSSAPSHPPAAHASLAPELAAYLGVFEPGAPPGYGAVASFAQMAGRQPNLLGYYSGWAAPFDTSFAQTIRKHGVTPFVQIDPTDASMTAIAAGTYDDYLRSYADRVRDFRHAVVIGFGHEMNAPWYSWGYGHTPAATFVAAWRHIVTVFRDQGADNVTLAMDGRSGQGRHRAGRLLVAGHPVRHVDRDRRVLLPFHRLLHQRLRQNHRSGAVLHQQASAALGDRGGA